MLAARNSTIRFFHRLVHNIIDAQFTFDLSGHIFIHRDSFNFWRWSSQAVSTPGL